MKVLLLKEVNKIGRKDEVVDVSDGYAKNFLLKKKLAVIATPQLIEHYEAKKRKEDSLRKEKTEEIQLLAGALSKEVFVFKVKTGKSNEVFSSVHSEQVCAKVLEFLHSHGGGALESDDVRCETKPIKELGEHSVSVKIGRGEYSKDVKIKIQIAPENV